jgi:hypothetical protein
MALALLGLMTGLAKGAASRVEKQREENESLVKTRLQLAAINKKKREAEIEARKKELSDRYSSVQPFLYEGMTEEQKLALVSNPTITKDFVERRSRGEQVDVNNYLITVKDKIPANFKSVQEYINTISAPPTAMTEEQMQGAFGRQEGILGANIGVSPGRAERIAAGLGGGSAAELLAYEKMQPVEAEPLTGIARLNVEQYGESFDSIEDAVKKAEIRAAEAEQRFGAEDDRTIAAQNRLAFFQSKYEAPVKSLESRAQTLASQIFDEQDPEKKAAMESRLSTIYEAIKTHKDAIEGTKQKSVATITASVEKAIQTRLEEKYGVELFSEPKTISLGDGEFYVARGLKSSVTPEVEQQILRDKRGFAQAALRAYGLLDDKGQPIYDSVRDVMYNYGLRGSLPERQQVGGAPSQAETPPATTAPIRPASAQPSPTTGNPITVELPDGRKAVFPNQKAADDFKKATGIR